jgi:hypothetical protein
VDANGKEVPWRTSTASRLRRGSPQLSCGRTAVHLLQLQSVDGHQQAPHYPGLHERIRKGEYQLPLYADLPGMPAHERRALWGIMIGNEGKTRFAVTTITTRPALTRTRICSSAP